MSEIQFAWDPRKAAENEQKHGVSFEEARSIFTDEHARLIDDPEHSADEERFILMGLQASDPRCWSQLPRAGGDHPDHLGPEGEPEATGHL